MTETIEEGTKTLLESPSINSTEQEEVVQSGVEIDDIEVLITCDGDSPSNVSQTAKTREWTALFVITLAIFVDVVAYGVILPLLPYYNQNLGLSKWEISVLVAAFAVGALPAQPIFGYLSDSQPSYGAETYNKIGEEDNVKKFSLLAFFVNKRYDRKKLIMVFGLVMLLLSTMMYSQATGFGMLILSRLLQGIASACSWSAGLSSLSSVFPAEKLGFAMGVVQFTNSLGALIGAPVGGFFYEIGGYPAPFIAIAVLCAIDGICRIFLMQNTVESSTAAPVQFETKSSAPQSTWDSLVELWYAMPFSSINAQLLIVFLAQLFQGMIIEYLNIVLPLSFDYCFDFTPKEIGILLGIMSLGNAIGAGVSGYVSDKYTSKQSVLFSGLLFLAVVLPVISIPFLQYGNLGNFALDRATELEAGSSLELEAIASLFSRPLEVISVLFLLLFLLGVAIGTFPALALVGTIIENNNLGHHSGFLYGVCTSAFTLGMMVGPIFAGFVMHLLRNKLFRALEDFGFANEFMLYLIPSVLVLLFTIVSWARFNKHSTN